MAVLDGADEAYSPAWWFKRLAVQLQDRRHGRENGRQWRRDLSRPARVKPGLDLLADHLDGDPPLLGCADGWKDGFREVTRLGRLNVAALIIEAKANRMALRDFRTAAANDELGDVRAREIMRANNLQVKARDVHTWMLAFRDSYAMVTPPGPGEEYATITAEDPREVITAEDPATGRTLAALKLYHDQWADQDVGYLFIREDDGEVTKRKAVKQGRTSLTSSPFRMSQGWHWEGGVETVPHQQMPIKRFGNRDHVGEYERHLDTLDRINDQILNKLVIAKLQAFRQRAVKGLPDTRKVAKDGVIVEEEIDYTDAFIAGPGELWRMPADVDFWESGIVDLNPLLQSIQKDLEHLAAVTSTPLHTITPDAMASGSAEGASLMREEHVYAVEACRDHADRPWADVMATAFAFMGDTERAKAEAIEPLWGPVERFSLSEKATAAAQASTTLPREAIQRDIWQYAPAEIPNLRVLDGRDFLLEAAKPAAATAVGQAAARPQVQQGVVERARERVEENTSGAADSAAAG